jgi:hypothetical protein
MIQNMSQAVLLLILANVLFSMKGFGDQVFFEKFKFFLISLPEQIWIQETLNI